MGRDNKTGLIKNRSVLTASEIGQYHYCPVSWFLQKEGFEPQSPHLQKGIENSLMYVFQHCPLKLVREKVYALNTVIQKKGGVMLDVFSDNYRTTIL